MVKIPKNRQDSEMFKGLKEAPTFEHETDGGQGQPPAKPSAKPAPAEPAMPAYATFLTPQLGEDLGKALLSLKVNLFKQGIVDYTFKVSTESNQVVLKAVPVVKKEK